MKKENGISPGEVISICLISSLFISLGIVSLFAHSIERNSTWECIDWSQSEDYIDLNIICDDNTTGHTILRGTPNKKLIEGYGIYWCGDLEYTYDIVSEQSRSCTKEAFISKVREI